MIYLFLFIGLLLHILMKYRDAYSRKEKFDWIRHAVLTGCVTPVAFLIVYFNSAHIDQITACGIGYMIDSIVKNMEGFTWKRIGNG